MSEGVPYADILILALIAGFIILRLRSVLGQRREGDTIDFMQRLKPSAENADTIVQLPDKSLKQKPKEQADIYMAALTDEKLIAALGAIKGKDAQFTAQWFLDGAHQAFEMVFDAFNRGDKPALKALLSDAVYQQFVSEIDARAAQDNKNDSTLVAIESKNIIQAALNGVLAQITVKFVSEQIHVIRNDKGEIVEGNPSTTQLVEDEWIFERDVTSRSPNWKIIET